MKIKKYSKKEIKKIAIALAKSSKEMEERKAAAEKLKEQSNERENMEK